MTITAKQHFRQKAYNQLKVAIAGIEQAKHPTIYALSCWYFLDGDDPRYPRLILGYNTTHQVQSQLPHASGEAEAKWNYAFWLQNELASIGGETDTQLAAWFQLTPYYYSQAENEAADEDEALFDKLLSQGEQFDNEFVEISISLIQQLFSEGIISDTFGKNIPVLLHELEYYDKPLAWTKRANPPGVADEFLQAFQGGLQ
ncbi:MAG: hypothetical protein ACRYFZ_18035 [Janthinobacterium lividum]